LREESRLRVCGNMVLKIIFWPKRDEVTGECRKLHKEDLNDLYSSPSNICCHITDKYNDIFTVLTCNFSKEKYVLPEDDLRIETWRRILSVLI
jgi:hypothetical protein